MFFAPPILTSFPNRLSCLSESDAVGLRRCAFMGGADQTAQNIICSALLADCESNEYGTLADGEARKLFVRLDKNGDGVTVAAATS